MISRIEAFKYRCFDRLDIKLGQYHVLAGAKFNRIKPDQWLWYEEFKQLLNQLSSKENLKPETQKDYT